jgi:hypothetical protein
MIICNQRKDAANARDACYHIFMRDYDMDVDTNDGLMTYGPGRIVEPH